MPNTSLVKKLILDGCRLPRHSRVYSIGPYATRVSFASQQQRALNLVWALDGDIDGGGMSLTGRRVAVIGGGIAGTTAAIGFLARGAGVTLFERAKDVLHVQRRARHRQIHPTVNVWPATRLDPTSPLPFMHWHEGRADAIIGQLKRRWSVYAPYINVATTKEVTEAKDLPHGVQLMVRDMDDPDAAPAPAVDTYHVAVFATGFGEETACDGDVRLGYWGPERPADRIENQLKALAKGACVTVGGTGDGGLIETLRVLCGTSFNAGVLSADTIKAVHGQADLRLDLKNIEAQLQPHWLNASLATKNEFSKLLETAYEGAARRHAALLDRTVLFDNATADLDITLFGEFEAPYTSLSAPIHKLMIAHARNRKRLKYKQARVIRHDRKTKRLSIVEPLADGSFPDKEGQTTIDVRSDMHVSRLGNRPPLGTVFPGDDSDLLRLQQSHVGNYIFAGLYGPEFFQTDPTFCGGNPIIRFGPTSQKYVEVRKADVAELLGTFLTKPNVKVRPADPIGGQQAWRYELLSTRPIQETKFHLYMAGNEPQPCRLYDVEIVVRRAENEPVVDLIT